MTKAMTHHPRGITGFNPGMAINSDAEGGLSVGGAMIDMTKVAASIIATMNIAPQHTQRETSPYIRQKPRGFDTVSRVFFPADVRIIRMRPKTLVEFQWSNLPLLSHDFSKTYQTKMSRKTTCQFSVMESHPAAMCSGGLPPSSIRAQEIRTTCLWKACEPSIETHS